MGLISLFPQYLSLKENIKYYNLKKKNLSLSPKQSWILFFSLSLFVFFFSLSRERGKRKKRENREREKEEREREGGRGEGGGGILGTEAERKFNQTVFPLHLGLLGSVRDNNEFAKTLPLFKVFSRIPRFIWT